MDVVPKIIHQIWLGPIPSHVATMMDAWRTSHPDYEYKLWTEGNIKEFTTSRIKYDSVVRKADHLRYEIMAKYGGIYLDADMHQVGHLSTLGDRPWLCAGPEKFEHINAAFASTPGNKLFVTASNNAGYIGPILETCGPRFFKRVVDTLGPCGHIDIPSDMFYAIRFEQRSLFRTVDWRKHVPASAVAAHAWHGSWLPTNT